MGKTKYRVMALLLGISAFLTGCTNAGNLVDDNLGSAAETVPLNIGMVTDIGGVSDHSFNQSAWEGLEKAEKDLGINPKYIETKDTNDYTKNLESIIGEKKDIIWGIGFAMADSIKSEAEKNPNQRYAIIDNDYGADTPKNVVGITFKENEASFLVGYIAGKMTKTNKVGFIGGVDMSLIHRFQYGFMAGAKYGNPNCEIISEYSGSFSDKAKGKEIATRMYNGGVDIIYHASGATGDGLIEAAKEMNKYCIGVDSDQNSAAPNNVITSAMKRVDNAIYNTVKDLKNGRWNGGANIQYGLAEGGVDIAPTSDKLVPKDILNEVDGIKAKIVSGELKVPRTKDEFNNQ